jgi:hypothetical protein
VDVDVDVEGIEEFGPHEHQYRLGICAICGAWIPWARCLDPTCGWSAPRDPETLRAAVSHRVTSAHPVRVHVG